VPALLFVILLALGPAIEAAAQQDEAPFEPAASAASTATVGAGPTADLRDAIARIDRSDFEDAIERGGDWRAAGLRDDAVFSLAAAFDAERAVRVLLARGFEVDALDVNGETALFAAASAGAGRTLSALLEAGADPDAVVRSRRAPGWTALFAATVAGRTEVVRLLVAAGAVVEVVDDHGRTPLFYASLHGQLAAAQLLLRRGADPRHADEAGRTPRSVAMALGQKALLHALGGGER
jgi:ankyrin repeat protein